MIQSPVNPIYTIGKRMLRLAGGVQGIISFRLEEKKWKGVWSAGRQLEPAKEYQWMIHRGIRYLLLRVRS